MQILSVGTWEDRPGVWVVVMEDEEDDYLAKLSPAEAEELADELREMAAVCRKQSEKREG
jgi:hypothetical protein